MSTYQELKGLKVKYLSSDTSGDRIKEGEVFYNSTDFNIKSFVATAAWHSSGPLGSGRYGLGDAGTLTAALGFGGYAGTGGGSAAGGFVASGNVPPTTAATEELTAETTSLNLKTITDS